MNRFTQQDLLQAAGLELRALQQEGARFVFEGGAREVQLLRDGARKGFHFLQVADFLVLGAQGRALMVKLRFKRGRHTGMGGWDHALDALGHGVLDLRCETPAHARQLLRKELISRGFAGALPPKVERTYGNQQRQAEQALGWARA